MKPSILDRFLGIIESAPASDRLLLRIGFFAVVAAILFLLFVLNNEQSVLTATRGGSFTEGVIGTPRFVNPVLATTRADQDVTALVYSGVLKIAENGTLENDLAESITVSEDGLTYDIIIRQDVRFHDDTPLTARDVAYTYRLIQDPDLKSPLRGNWTDVIIEENGEYGLSVILEEAYAPFIENFTVGIMPAHVWSSLPTEQLPFSLRNTEPIGSGPFQYSSARRGDSGLITEYTLTAFRDSIYNAKIDAINIQFFQNEVDLETAYADGEIDASAYIALESIGELLSNDTTVYEIPLPRTFGLFFNQNRSAALRDKAVREAIGAAIDREALIETALYSYGIPINEPMSMPYDTLESEDSITSSSSASSTTPSDILRSAGWSKNGSGLWEKTIDGELVELSITIRTNNTPLFATLIEEVADQLRAEGIVVITEQFEQTGLVQSVIRPRDFQVLLFGLDMSRSYDLFPFWHSSQQDDPGLNIAQYANVTVDDLLSDARATQDETERQALLIEASELIAEEQPAVFLFRPSLVYLAHEDIGVTAFNHLGRPADRFSNIEDWHTNAESLWALFRKDM